MTDLVISEKDLKRIKKGKHVYKWANSHKHNIYMQSMSTWVENKIQKLEEQLALLKQQPAKVRKPYTKKNKEYWEGYSPIKEAQHVVSN